MIVVRKRTNVTEEAPYSCSQSWTAHTIRAVLGLDKEDRTVAMELTPEEAECLAADLLRAAGKAKAMRERQGA